eukprot:snap_masked-scaffold_6-processed-gene-19.29-mRNA-1 protein AED:1.00 eAED:1.00 QI:0/-1/0/0/-1/1/1/0/59
MEKEKFLRNLCTQVCSLGFGTEEHSVFTWFNLFSEFSEYLENTSSNSFRALSAVCILKK